MNHSTRQASTWARGLAVAALMTAPVLLLPEPTEAQSLSASGTLELHGGSTLRSWNCGTGDLRFQFEAGEGDLTLDSLADAVASLVLRVPTAALDCDNDRQTGHMWEALETREFPWVVFRMTSYELAEADGDGDVRLVLSGTLEILEEVRDVEVSVDGRMEDGGLRITGTHELDMTEWGVEPPRLMLGAIRVHDQVQVHIDVHLAPARRP